jgi:hypothetical protein
MQGFWERETVHHKGYGTGTENKTFWKRKNGFLGSLAIERES